MSSNAASERDMADLAKKIGKLVRDRPSKAGNAHTWFPCIEAVLRSRNLFYVVAPEDVREKKKRALLKTVAGDDKGKKAQLELDTLRHEDQVIAIL